MSITRFNKGVVKFTFKAGEDFKYRTLKELYKENGQDKVYKVKGLYINTKSKFGNAPVAVTDELYVNLPKHLLETIEDIRKDEKLVEDINNDLVGFTIYEYHNEDYNNKGYSINWVELEESEHEGFSSTDEDIPF